MKKVSLVVALFLFCLNVFAIDATQYQATVPVASQEQDDWQKGVTAGLAQLLTSLTGNADILQNRNIKKQLDQASTYVQSFTYVIDNTNQQNPLQLQIQFYPQAIEQLIQQAGKTTTAPVVTNKTPPVLLIWLATSTPQGNQLINSNTPNAIATSLKNAATQHNLAILLPMMDLQDMQAISADNVWQLNNEAAISAAKRYDTQNILEAKLYQDETQQWHADWALIKGHEMAQDSVVAPDANQAIMQMINKIVSAAAVTKTASTKGSQALTLHISNVNGLDDYANVVKYLKGLSPVNGVNVVDVQPDGLTINVNANGGETALDAAINAGSQMSALPSDPTNQSVLNYRWLTTNSDAATTPAAAATNPPATTATPNNNNQNSNDNAGIDMGS